MKINLLPILILITLVFCFSSIWAQCPQEPNDNGQCDTLHVELWSADTTFNPPAPDFARVALYVTHDVPDPVIDSIAAFVIPLCYTHTNASQYCSLTGYWNNTSFTNPRSIFRHLTQGSDTLHNWMMDRYEEGKGEEWNGIILNLNGTSHFWLSLIPAGLEDQRFGTETHRLLATMTFKIEDTMSICLDPCLWPPASTLKFTRSDSPTYVPRHKMPLCFKLDTLHTNTVRQQEGSDNNRPGGFSLSQNYPNPFNPTTNIPFAVHGSQFTVHSPIPTTLKIYNVLGQKVRTLVDEPLKPGSYEVVWDGKNDSGKEVSSGIYFYRIKTSEFSQTKKMVLLR